MDLVHIRRKAGGTAPYSDLKPLCDTTSRSRSRCYHMTVILMLSALKRGHQIRGISGARDEFDSDLSI